MSKGKSKPLPPARPSSFLSGAGGTMRTDYLGGGVVRETILRDGKEVSSRIVDRNAPKSWWERMLNR